LLEVIGDAEAFDPVGTSHSAVHAPGACPLIAPVPQPDVRRDRCPVWFLAYREAAAGGRGFERGFAWLGHGLVSDKCPKQRCRASAYRYVAPYRTFAMDQGVSVSCMQCCEVLCSVFLPYKGTLPALNDVIAGHIQLMFSDLAPAYPLIQAGKLRALGV